MASSKSSIPASGVSRLLLPVVVALGSAGAFIIAFPPFNQPWGVLVFLVPVIKWAFGLPRWRTFLVAAFGAGWAGWFGVLIWLRHILPPWGWVGLAILSAVLAGFSLAWFAAVRWAAPKLREATRGKRVLGLLALAGWWVVLDWVRSWLFTGFPWLPLPAAFWKFPLLLQPLEWTGTWGLTFVIVFFNLGLVCGTGANALTPPLPQRKIWWPARFGAEIMAPTLLLLGSVLMAFINMERKPLRPQPLLRVGFVQPWTPPLLKWDAAAEMENWNELQKLSAFFAYRSENRNNVDLILWPEAAPPFGVQGADAGPARQAVEKLSDDLSRPILFGAVGEAPAARGSSTPPGVLDGVFLVEPNRGFAKETYAKRHLVPFGEYNPLHNWLPFLGKVVPIDQDTVPGDRAVTLPLTISTGQKIQIGPLVCYEDVFPNLARDQVKAGASLLVVVTNDAWYGTGGGALQHAAHSVLRAIETRRPVVRCGNAGWSGFIDQDGYAFAFEKDQEAMKTAWIFAAHGTTYFRGAGGAVYVYTYPQYDGHETLYVRFGDWFVGLSALLVLGGVAGLRRVGTPGVAP